jgi:hypothetical protein
VLRNFARQLVQFRDRLQRFLIGRRLPGRCLHHCRQLQFLEQQCAHLLGRIEIEGAPGEFRGVLLQYQHAPAQVHRLPPQLVHVDHDAVGLDALEHRHQWDFNLAIHAFQRRFTRQLRRQHAMQTQGDVGILGGVAGGVVERDLRERDLLGALAGDIGVLDRVVAQIPPGQRIHVVATGAGVPDETFEHGVVSVTSHFDAVATQHVQVVLAVLAEFFLRRIAKQRPQCVQHSIARQLLRCAGIVVCQRDVRRLAWFDRQAQSHQLCAQRIERIGFGIKREFVRCPQLVDPGIELPARQHGLVFARHR